MRSDISIQTKLFRSPCTFILSDVAEYLLGPTVPFPHASFYTPPNTDTMAVPSLPLGCPMGCVNVPCRLHNTISSVAASCSSPLHNQLLCTGQSGVLFFLPFPATNMIPPLTEPPLSPALKVMLPPRQVEAFHLAAG